VHAAGQVVAFYHDWQHSMKQMKAALNNYLPKSIAVQAVNQVADDFHPRYDAVSREYKYAITIAEDRQPEKERFMWRIYGHLDWERIKEAASLFLGKHDFSQFGRALKEDGSTKREVMISEWKQISPADHEYTICANAFLYHMVRRIVFVLVKTGEGKIEQEVIKDVLAGKKRKIMAGISPACGLTLTKVNYGENKDERI
jgi:tRNA pseudouridine38-40 synthase